MTRDEARNALNSKAQVVVRRNGSVWTGRVRALVDQPCVILERDDGRMQAVVLDGATLERGGPDVG